MTACYNHSDREGSKVGPTGWHSSLPYCPECHAANDKKNAAYGKKRRKDRAQSYSNAVRNYNK